MYTTPERIGKSAAAFNFLRILKSKNLLERIVIDEVHCVSQWGQDFRKDYSHLGKVKFLIKN